MWFKIASKCIHFLFYILFSVYQYGHSFAEISWLCFASSYPSSLLLSENFHLFILPASCSILILLPAGSPQTRSQFIGTSLLCSLHTVVQYPWIQPLLACINPSQFRCCSQIGPINIQWIPVVNLGFSCCLVHHISLLALLSPSLAVTLGMPCTGGGSFPQACLWG